MFSCTDSYTQAHKGQHLSLSELGGLRQAARKADCLGSGSETLLPRHKRSSSQGLTAQERQTSAIKAVHPNSRQGSPKRGLTSLKSPVRDVQHRLQKTQKLLDVLQFGQLHEQVSGQQQGHLEKFLVGLKFDDLFSCRVGTSFCLCAAHRH